MTCPWSLDDGAFVLGAMDPAERQRYEQHLAGCASCAGSVQMLTALPALLNRVKTAQPSRSVHPSRPPETLLPRLLAALRADRRAARRRVQALLAAAACIALVVGAALALGLHATRQHPAARPQTVAMQTLTATPISAQVQILPRPWGTAVEMNCRYAGTSGPYAGGGWYELVAADRAGHTRQLASWTAVPGQTAHVTGTTSWHGADLAWLEVRDATSTPVLRLTR